MISPRSATFCALSLAATLVASRADAHLMVAQHGTLNLVGDGAFMVLSIPATALPGADDDHDGRLSRAELERHYRDVAAAVAAGVTLVGGGAAWRRVLLALTCFTVGHAVTLGLAVTGAVNVAPSVVEPAIAATLIGMALLDGVAHARKVVIDARLRLGLVFGCALIHGLGFAGALRDLGVEPGDRAPLVAGFNLGVELGQAAVVTVALAAVWILSRIFSPGELARSRQVARAVVLVAGCAWLVMRLRGAST